MRKTALITGATAGIGFELARCFARGGHALVLVARTRPRLETAAEKLKAEFGVDARLITADLAQPEGPESVFEACNSQEIAVDYLVNSAGFGLAGPFAKTDIATELEMIQLNISAYVQLTKLFMQGMIERDIGGILNVSSLGAFQPGPSFSIYCATKAFILSFTEAIAFELRPTGVLVCALCPGAVKTEFQSRANTDGIRLGNAATLKFMSAEAVAVAGYHGLMIGESVVVPGLSNKLFVQAGRVAPRSVITWIAAGAMKSL